MRQALYSSICWNRISFVLLLLSVITLGFAFALQPRISDDWYLIWNYQEGMGPLDFIKYEYLNWTGRGWMIFLSAFVLPNPVVETTYRAFIVVEILLLVALAWYCALGPGAWRRTRENYQALSIFGCLLWLALPVRDQTVAWVSANFVYLVSALFSLAFMAWIERCLAITQAEHKDAPLLNIGLRTLSFLVGFASGVAHEQVAVACAAYLVLTLIRLKSKSSLGLHKIGLRIWFTGMGLVVGASVLVCAPGNYVRMEKIPSPSLLEVIERMVLYIPGAFFELGTGATGKNIWLGALVLTLLNFHHGSLPGGIQASLKRGGFWWIISLCSLLAMAPATNFISTRTLFFPVIFLFIGFAAMACRAPSTAVDALAGSVRAGGLVHNKNESSFALNTTALMILACLVLAEAVACLVSNISVAAEFVRRIEIVELTRHSSANANSPPIRVPFIATQPAALTYIQSPEHDREFLEKWGRQIGHPILHDVSVSAPLPNSFSPLKAIKYRHRE